MYKGFSPREDVALNVAGCAAILVATCPEGHTYNAEFRHATLYFYVAKAHVTSAFVLFFCMGYVAWYCADDTANELPARQRSRWARVYAPIYTTSAILMVVCPILAVICYYFVTRKYVTLAAEWAGVWAFALYWFAKSAEVQASKIEIKAIKKAAEVRLRPGAGFKQPPFAAG